LRPYSALNSLVFTLNSCRASGAGKTGATALRVPPSILAAGKRYTATIVAFREEDKIAISSVTTVLGTFTP